LTQSVTVVYINFLIKNDKTKKWHMGWENLQNYIQCIYSGHENH
jgi:hypothetical protein